MKKQGRRSFLHHGAMFGSALLFMRPGKSRAAVNETSPVNETLKTLHNLRTIHGDFTDQNVPDTHINEILNASVRSANASNMQNYSIIVVKDKDKIQKVCGYRGSFMLVYCVDLNRMKSCANQLDHPYIPEGTTGFITAAVSTGLAVQNAVIAGKSLGIDSLVTNGLHRGDMERQWELLDLPEKYCFPLISVVFGYPAHEPEYLKGRVHGIGLVHHEHYEKLTPEQTAELINTYDDPQTHLALNDNWSEQGHKHYMDWLFTQWMGRSANPMQEESQLFKLLKRSGFVDMQRV